MQYRELIEKHLDSLWSAAMRFTKNRQDAEDLVQETCMKAFENLGSLRSEGKAKAWLFKILANTFINKYRKGQTAPEHVDIEPELLEPIFFKTGQYIDPEKDLFLNIMDEEIKIAIDSLPIEFRMAVVLVDIEELSYREVEDILRISSGTLSSRLYRGRRLLRDSLYEYAKKKGFLKEKRR
ncbi:MAG: sigma-70 family RNA polymerase sigma factor [Nitrospirae bacterium]|nr:sigma-70 family RNA polymerase sigma factor [Nitrospirota bacterium]